MKFKAKTTGDQFEASHIGMRCPHCRHTASMEPIGHSKDGHGSVGVNSVHYGSRRCPRNDCRGHVFVVVDHTGKLIASYPPEVIDFDSSGIPSRIVSVFEEAISCSAQKLHVATAIMVRRTLEELCLDKQAVGKTLKDRLTALQGLVVLPVALRDAIQDLRLLGNDAAHVEAQTFNQVSDAEVNVAIDLTKEILKAIYQYDNLLARLQALKNS